MSRRTLLITVLAVVVGLVAVTFVPPSNSMRSEMAEALVRHELATPDSYLAANLNYKPPHYLSLVGDRHPVDPSPDVLKRLTTPSFHVFPGSMWIKGQGTRIYIRAPTPLGLGFYWVGHHYFCGSLCASDNIAIMFYDMHHWHVLTSYMTSIS